MVGRYVGTRLHSLDNFYKINVDKTNTGEYVFSCDECNFILIRVAEQDNFSGVHVFHTKECCRIHKKTNLKTISPCSKK